MKERGQALFCLVAGGGDAVTGLLLVGAPALVLRLLGLPRPADLALLRFVGVFVTCVGLAYLYPWLGRAHRQGRLLAALEMTAAVRLAVALFLGIAVAAGTLELPWAQVGGYDAAVALVQIGLLARGGFGSEVGES
jgi:hypothetical protein